MKQLLAVAVAILTSGTAHAQDRGPAPQTGKEHPEVLRGAKESGAMETTLDRGKSTTGMNKKSRGANKVGGYPK
jgi:hypothetical protein